MKSKKNKLKSKALKRNELKMARALQFDRSKKTNFIEYMLENPNYFELIFKLECTLENINKEFDWIKTNNKLEKEESTPLSYKPRPKFMWYS